MTAWQATVRTAVQVPLSDAASVPTFRSFRDLSDGREHIAVSFEQTKAAAGSEPAETLAPLLRIHSECLTGDTLGSLRCDCGPQLRESIDLLSRHGGILLYLRQEGRGIGLYNKLDAYVLQDQGVDTYEANVRLNLPSDGRDFSVAAEMLHALGISRVRLLSNNPAKREGIESGGIAVDEMVPTGVYLTRHNEQYLRAKVELQGHTLASLGSGARRGEG